LANACLNTKVFANIKSANHSEKIDLPNKIATKYSSYMVYCNTSEYDWKQQFYVWAYKHS